MDFPKKCRKRFRHDPLQSERLKEQIFKNEEYAMENRFKVHAKKIKIEDVEIDDYVNESFCSEEESTSDSEIDSDESDNESYAEESEEKSNTEKSKKNSNAQESEKNFNAQESEKNFNRRGSNDDLHPRKSDKPSLKIDTSRFGRSVTVKFMNESEIQVPVQMRSPDRGSWNIENERYLPDGTLKPQYRWEVPVILPNRQYPTILEGRYFNPYDPSRLDVMDDLLIDSDRHIHDIAKLFENH